MLPRLFVAALLVSCAPVPECPELPAEIDFGEVEHFHTAGAELPLARSGQPEVGALSAPFSIFLETERFRVLQVKFMPLDAREHRATWRVRPGPTCEPTDIALRGLGAGRVELSDTDVDFGVLPANETRTQTVVVTNARREPRDVELRVTSPRSTAWLEVTPRSFRLEPGATQEVTVTVTATMPGAQLAEVLIDDVPRATVRYFGFLPRIGFSFEPVRIVLPAFAESTIVPRTFTVSNVGEGVLTISQVVATPALEIALGPPTTLSAGASAPVTVYFDTVGPLGPRDYELRFSSDDVMQPDAGFVFRTDRRAFEPCDAALEVPDAAMTAPLNTPVSLVFFNPGANDCLIDDLHFEPPTGWAPLSETQLIVPAQSRRVVQVTRTTSGRGLMRYRPMRPHAPYLQIEFSP